MHEWQWHWMSNGFVGAVVFLLLLVLAVLWFLLPFAIFGTKDRFDFRWSRRVCVTNQKC